MEKMPITIISGYLGSGKTTLLNHILKNKQNLKAAVIVNDVGAINVDASLIKKSDGIDLISNEVLELSNGCICCSLSQGLTQAIESIIKKQKYDHIFIEASGVSEPMPIAQAIMLGYTSDYKLLSNQCYIDSLITIVDANRIKNEFKLGTVNQHYDESIAELISEQIEFCNTVILNKIDLITETEKEAVKNFIQVIQTKATIIETTYANVDTNEIVNRNLFSFDDLVQDNHLNLQKDLSNERKHHDIYSFIYQAKRPFNLKKLEALTQNFPENIIRTKGMMWLDVDHEKSFLLSQAGNQISLLEGTPWVGTYPVMFQEEVLKLDPKLKHTWHQKYQDRVTELVIIGKEMDEKEIHKLFDLCLLTEDELSESFMNYLKTRIKPF